MTVYHMAYERLAAKNPELKRRDYDTVYDGLKLEFTQLANALYPGEQDDCVRFDDVAKTIEVDLYGEDFLVRYSQFAQKMKNAFLPYDKDYKLGTGATTPETLNAMYFTDESKDKYATLVEDSRAALRQVTPRDPPANTPAPDPTASGLDNLKSIIDSGPGVSFGGDHGDPSRDQIVQQLLNDPDHGDIGIFFIEELKVVDQPLIEQYLSSPPNTPMPKMLMQRAQAVAGVKEMIEKIKQVNDAKLDPRDRIKIYGVNASEAKLRTEMGALQYEGRDVMMNAVLKEVMDKAIKENPGKKFLSFVGEVHSNTHPGGIPGVSQMYGVPAIKMGANGQIAVDPDNKKLRGMPSQEEMQRIDARCKATALNDPTWGNRNDAQKHDFVQEAIRFEQAMTAFTAVRKAVDDIVSTEEQINNPTKFNLDANAVQLLKAGMVNLKKAYTDAQAKATEAVQTMRADAPGAIKMKDGDGMPLLYHAAAIANPDAVGELIAEDPTDLDTKFKGGMTAAHLMVHARPFLDEDLRKQKLQDQFNGLGKLLGAGASPNLKNGKGETPMHLAALNGNADAVEDLLLYGGSATEKDNRNWTPIDTCLASTKTTVEKVFVDKGVLSKTFVPDVPNPSIVDVLVQVTKCEDANDAVGIREMYDRMYADPLLKPILEAAAIDAMQDRDPPKEGGVRIFVGDKASTGRMFAAPEWQTGGQGGYDEKANTFLLAGKPQKGNPREGTLIHEMTHMVVRKMYGDKTVPYPDGDNQAEQEYKQAFADDMKNMHLMTGDKNEGEGRIRDRICGRLKVYADRDGDGQMLQELIVGVPQLIAEFGPEVVQRYAPSMMKQYKDFATKVETKMQTDPTYSDVRRGLDNTILDNKLKTNPPKKPTPPTEWLKKDSKDLTIDGLIAKVRTDYAVKNGVPNLTGSRATFAYDPSVFEVRGTDKVAFEKKMAAIEKGLEKAFAQGDLPDEVSPDHIRALVLNTSKRAGELTADQLEEAVSGHVANWKRDGKIRLVEHRLAKGENVPSTDLAEAVLLQAEDAARRKLVSSDPTATIEVDEGKHKALVKDLAKELAKVLDKMNDKKRKETLPLLISKLSESMVNSPKSGFSVKKKNQANNPGHVSLDKKAIRKAWLGKLAALKV